MRDALVNRLLLLEEQVYMLLLENERQIEVGNVKWQIFRVKHAKHVDLLCNLLNTALQLSHALLIASMLPDDVLNDLLADADLLIEIDILERRWQKEILRDCHLLLGIITLQLNHSHAI